MADATATPLGPLWIPDHELLRRIGGGSYGEVWLARNVLGELRAVKIVYRSRFDHERPYEREFEGIHKFEPISRSHESQVDILHVGRNDAEGYFYYIMELADDAGPASNSAVRGSSSGEAAAAHKPDLRNSKPETYVPHTLKHDLHNRGRLPVNECIEIGLALCRALQHLHGHGLVHRDIKPSNIIFANGVPKLADIGLVASMDATMSFVGTSGFVPPEGPGTPQGDLYSLGKVLYEISMGRDRIEFPKLPTDLAESADAQRLLELNAIIVKACHHDSQQRHPSADAMSTELELLQEGGSVRRRRGAERRWQWAKKLSVAAAVVVVLLATGLFLASRVIHSTSSTNGGAAEVNAIAVLPFQTKNNDTPTRYLCRMISDEVLQYSTNSTRLRVVPYSPALITNAISHIAEELHVRTALLGNMKRSSNQLYVTARLINALDNKELWSVTYDRYGGSTNVPSIAKDVVSNVVRVLKVSLPESAWERMDANFARRLTAYRFYTQAIGLPRNNSDGINETIDLLNRAILEDSRFGAAYADLADCYSQGADWLIPMKQAMTEAKKNALLALDLDDSLANAHLTLGRVYLAHELDFKRANAEFQRAIDVLPTNGRVYGDYAVALSGLGYFEEAEQILKQGDAVDPQSHNLLGGWYSRFYYERRFDEALRAGERFVALYSDSAVGLLDLAQAQERLGRYDDALATAQRMMQVDTAPDFVAFLGMIHARLGHHEEAEKALQDLRASLSARRTSPLFAAMIPLALGQTNQAIEHLRRAVDEYPQRALVLQTDPFWDELRADSRFQALLEKIEVSGLLGSQ